MDCSNARFFAGDEVRVIRNIRNDGSFIGSEKGTLLVNQGETGVVRSSGYFLQNQIIYQIYVPAIERTLGVRDSEVIDISLEWTPCLFRSLDMAQLTLSLKMHGKIVAEKGDLVEVQRVYRDLDTGELHYGITLADEFVKISAKVLEVPKSSKEREAYG